MASSVSSANSGNGVSAVESTLSRYPPARIEDQLHGHSGEARLRLLGELIRTELQQRLEFGEPARVEEFLHRFPEIAGEPRLLRDLLEVEYRQRHSREPALSREEWLVRFPQLAELTKIDRPQRPEQIPSPELDPFGTIPPAPSDGPLYDGLRIDDIAPLPSSFSVYPTIPGYEIESELGRGGMGVVFRARQTALERTVALKMILHSELANDDDRQRFQGEAQAAARLQHANIVQIHEVGQYQRSPYFSMEFCSGGSLRDMLEKAVLPPRRAAEYVQLLARAVHVAHQQNIVHRDLKPANILLTADGTPKISDFGLAKRLDVASQTQTGDIMGTPSYMAPEQALGKTGQVGPVSDVYALCAILYEALTGHPPFKGASSLDTLRQVTTRDPVPPRQLQAGIPRDLETICLKGLHKDPKHRYDSAQALADDLGRFLANAPILARRSGPIQHAIKWVRRQPALAAALVLAVLAVLGLAVGGLFYGLYKEQQSRWLSEQLRLEQAQARWHEAVDGHDNKGLQAEAAAQQALAEGNEAEAIRLFIQAGQHWERALGALDSEPDLVDPRRREELEQRHAQAIRYVKDHSRKQDVTARAGELARMREIILFHEISMAPNERESNSQTICRVAAQALATFGIEPGVPPGEMSRLLDVEHLPGLTADIRQEVVGWIYEVLLSWADAEVNPQLGKDREQEKQALARGLDLLAMADTLARGQKIPVPAEYHRRRARYLTRNGDEAGARVEQQQAERLGINSPLDRYLFALDAFREGRAEEASKACAEVLQQQRKHFWARYLLGLCHLRLRQWRDAWIDFSSCVTARADFVWARMLRAEVEIQMGEPKDLEAAHKDLAEVVLPMNDSLARYTYLTIASRLNIKRKRWAEARRDLEQAIALRPRDVQGYLGLAEVHRQQKEWDQALANLDQAVKLQPGGGVYFTRYRINKEKGDLKSARQDVERAIALAGKGTVPAWLASAHVELGYLAEQAGEYDRALEQFEQALRVTPNYLPALRQKAQTLKTLRKYREAGAVLDRCLAQSPNDVTLHKARGWLHASLGEHRQALRSYNLALAMKPEDIELRNFRGWALLQANAPDLALADFQFVIDKNAEHLTDGLCGRAHIRVLKGQVKAALADVEQALRQAKRDPNVFIHAACIYSRASEITTGPDRGSREIARRHLDTAFDLLSQALQQVPADRRPAFWRERIANEQALVILRGQPRFAEFERRFGREKS